MPVRERTLASICAEAVSVGGLTARHLHAGRGTRCEQCDSAHWCLVVRHKQLKR